MDESRPKPVEPRITWQEAVDAWRLLLDTAEAIRNKSEAVSAQSNDEKESQL